MNSPQFYIGWEHSFLWTESKASGADVERIRSQLEVFGEFASAVKIYYDRSTPFRMHKPTSEDDAYLGRVCSASKVWFPARKLVFVGGKPYGDKYAPKE